MAIDHQVSFQHSCKGSPVRNHPLEVGSYPDLAQQGRLGSVDLPWGSFLQGETRLVCSLIAPPVPTVKRMGSLQISSTSFPAQAARSI